MRTTLNIDDDVSTRVQELARRDGRSLSRVVNDLLRTGLRAGRVARPDPYEPPTFDTGAALVDVTDVAGALERLEDGG